MISGSPTAWFRPYGGQPCRALSARPSNCNPNSCDRHDALENKGDTNHSPKHSQALKKRCDEIGIPCVLKIGGTVEGGSEQTPVEFLLKHLRKESK